MRPLTRLFDHESYDIVMLNDDGRWRMTTNRSITFALIDMLSALPVSFSQRYLPASFRIWRSAMPRPQQKPKCLPFLQILSRLDRQLRR